MDEFGLCQKPLVDPYDALKTVHDVSRSSELVRSSRPLRPELLDWIDFNVNSRRSKLAERSLESMPSRCVLKAFAHSDLR